MPPLLQKDDERRCNLVTGVERKGFAEALTFYSLDLLSKCLLSTCCMPGTSPGIQQPAEQVVPLDFVEHTFSWAYTVAESSRTSTYVLWEMMAKGSKPEGPPEGEGGAGLMVGPTAEWRNAGRWGWSTGLHARCGEPWTLHSEVRTVCHRYGKSLKDLI